MILERYPNVGSVHPRSISPYHSDQFLFAVRMRLELRKVCARLDRYSSACPRWLWEGVCVQGQCVATQRPCWSVRKTAIADLGDVRVMRRCPSFPHRPCPPSTHLSLKLLPHVLVSLSSNHEVANVEEDQYLEPCSSFRVFHDLPHTRVSLALCPRHLAQTCVHWLYPIVRHSHPDRSPLLEFPMRIRLRRQAHSQG